MREGIVLKGDTRPTESVRLRRATQSRGMVPVVTQVSAGGVVFRPGEDGVEVALICVGDSRRWQLPKGLVEPGESQAAGAQREVREETGIVGELVVPLQVIDFWYRGLNEGKVVRCHKFVHFFLFRFCDGDVSLHDGEVREARWVPIDEALGKLTFRSERAVLDQAACMLAGGGGRAPRP